MIRRFVAALAATALIASLSISSVAAAPTPEGVLRASFEGYLNGGLGASYATWVRGAPAWSHASSTGIDLEAGAARIGLYEPQEHCSSNLFGIWAMFWDGSRAGLEGSTYNMWFGPVGDLAPLAIQKTAVKRATDAQGWYFGGDPVWWQSVGVPVYGRLAVGDYEFHATVDSEAYGPFEWDVHISIVDC